MCILIVKPCGAQFPELAAIQNSVDNNPDGFALAYNDGYKLKTYKTMSAARFLATYRRLAASLNAKDTAMIIHARIATHGTIGIKNCHCWKALEGRLNEMAFAHNGILSIANRNDMTDSETFLRDYFEPSYIKGGWATASEIIRRKIGSSKFAFIDRLGTINTFGSFIHDGGCYYSNRSYEHQSFARCADPRYWTKQKPLAK